MQKSTIIFHNFVILAFTFLIANSATAQDTILLQVPSSNVQINAAISVGDTETVEMFKREDNQIKNALIKDFRANFQFCPVYFFESKDVELVKSKEFGKVTFYDENVAVAKLPETMTDYYIANISFYPPETVVIGEQDGTTITEETGGESHLGLGIILRDKAYKPLKGKLRFTPCRIGKRGNILDKKKRYYVFWGGKAFSRKLGKFDPQ